MEKIPLLSPPFPSSSSSTKRRLCPLSAGGVVHSFRPAVIPISPPAAVFLISYALQFGRLLYLPPAFQAVARSPPRRSAVRRGLSRSSRHGCPCPAWRPPAATQSVTYALGVPAVPPIFSASGVSSTCSRSPLEVLPSFFCAVVPSCRLLWLLQSFPAQSPAPCLAAFCAPVLAFSSSTSRCFPCLLPFYPGFISSKPAFPLDGYILRRI